MWKIYDLKFWTVMILFCLLFIGSIQALNEATPAAATNVPNFLIYLFEDYYEEYEKQHLLEYELFCSSFNLALNDKDNAYLFYQLSFFHSLFTTNDAVDGNTGNGILEIPYFWHWRTPNPRHQISYISSGDLLTLHKAPTPYEAYNHFADIDRVPALFLADLFTETEQYYHPIVGKFASFGWCSEREMAFVALLEILGYKGKVGNNFQHSWSEFAVEFTTTENDCLTIIAIIDNTYNNFGWQKLPKNESLVIWQNSYENSKYARWYNANAHAEAQKIQIKNIKVPTAAALRIENKVRAYFNMDLLPTNEITDEHTALLEE